jgi:hypothetical protein
MGEAFDAARNEFDDAHAQEIVAKQIIAPRVLASAMSSAFETRPLQL